MTTIEKLNRVAVESDFFSAVPDYRFQYGNIVAKIAKAIRQKRKSLGYSQKEFADFMGVSQGMVSKWESAEYNFTLSKMTAILSKLDLNVDVEIISKSKNHQKVSSYYPLMGQPLVLDSMRSNGNIKVGYIA